MAETKSLPRNADVDGVGPPLWKIVTAFAAIYVIWGSTYLAIQWAVKDGLPPFLMAGVRFLLAGGMMVAFARWRGVPRPEPVHWRSAFVAGALLLLGGNGCVAWASLRMPSGVSSLFIATTPLWIVAIDWLGHGGKRPSVQVAVGLLLGCAGLVLLAFSKIEASGGTALSEKPLDPWAVGALVVGPICWSFGTIYCRSANFPRSSILGVGMQQIAGGALLLVAALIDGELAGLDLSAVPTRSWGAFLYLLTVGSLVAFTAYIWLLQHASAAKVSTYAYVNPVVAIFLGWLLNGEQPHTSTLEAAGIILFAVVLITFDKIREAGRLERSRKV